MTEHPIHRSHPGRPKILNSPIVKIVNLTQQHINILDSYKGNNSEIIRNLIELSTINKKELILFKENLELKNKVKDLNHKIKELNKEISKKPGSIAKIEINKDYLEETKTKFKNYCARASPSFDEQLSYLRIRAKDLGIPVLKLHKMIIS